jgi:hypothetical protein
MEGKRSAWGVWLWNGFRSFQIEDYAPLVTICGRHSDIIYDLRYYDGEKGFNNESSDEFGRSEIQPRKRAIFNVEPPEWARKVNRAARPAHFYDPPYNDPYSD